MHRRRSRRRSSLVRLVLTLLCVAAALALPATDAAAEPSWTTYHGDAARSGDDVEDPAITQAPTLAWHSQDLGAPIWSEPLVLGSRVYVATVGDDVYALDAATGAVAWATNVGTPVPSTALPCGDVEPTVGIVGTPVIDTATSTLYAVADTWNGAPHHELVALSLATGQVLRRTNVDPPGADPATLLQRSALNLDDGDVVFGFGGNFGSCSGALAPAVAVPTSGGAARFWQDHASVPVTAGGIWATSGVAVDDSGAMFAATANPVPPLGEPATVYDYSDSVLKLSLGDFVANPTESPAPAGWFEPPDWEERGNRDLDLGSAGPQLLPGGVLFEAGKDGLGYLLDEGKLESEPGTPAVYSGRTCEGSGSFGGDAFAGSTIYIPCTNGVQALAYNEAARTFTPLWQGPSDAFGPPIVSGGLVWDAASGGFNGGGTKLYGLDPTSGHALYTLTLPSAIADHFATPSAAGGRLFIATGSTETAYSLGVAPAPGNTAPEGPGNTTRQAGPGDTTPGAAPGTAPGATPDGAAPGTATLTAGRSDALVPALASTDLHADRGGRVRIELRCRATSAICRGVLTLRAQLVSYVRAKHAGLRRVVYRALGSAGFKHARGTFYVTIRLGPHGRALLGEYRGRLTLLVTVSAPPAHEGRTRATLLARR